MNITPLNFYEKGENFEKSLNYNEDIINNKRACEFGNSNALVNLNNLYKNNYDKEDFYFDCDSDCDSYCDSDSKYYNKNSESEENHNLIKIKCKYSHKYKNKMFKLLLNYFYKIFF
jgi:hypothetical protein